MKTARFEFSPELSPLLEHRLRQGSFDYAFNGPQTAKHLVEALGIPHTEVGGLLVNSIPAALDYQVQDGDRMQVSASSEAEAQQAGEEPEPRFVLDGHLGRLAAYLRMLGLDCLYRNDYSDPQLVQISVAEGRVLLTRDRRLLMHKALLQGCLLRSLDPEKQFVQVIRRFGLRNWTRPFRRCLECNQVLQEVEKAEILDRLEPLTRKYYDEFRLCPGCNRIYWKGSHYERMLQLIERSVDNSGEQQAQHTAGR